MSFIPDQHREPEKVYLVGVFEQDSLDAEISLEELKELVRNLDLKIQGNVLVKLREKHANFLLGSGKVAEIIEDAKAAECDMIIFDCVLSPAQQRNWEKESKLRVIDRHEIILNIFAMRAKTREAYLQVELAQLEYALPRLKRAWTHLERQRGGGVTMRGAGEKQIELDERMIRDQLKKVKEELSQVMKQRNSQRKQRLKVPVPTTAIVGYTNAGKSSLLNKLSDADVYVADKLFATLDPTTRRVELPAGQLVLATDTVGFVQNLPHSLVESFKATLEETILADFLIHVVDVTSPYVETQMKTTHDVLNDLGANMKRCILVFNKIDRASNDMTLVSLRARFPKAVFTSVYTGEGIIELQEAMIEMLKNSIQEMILKIPYDEYGVITELHQIGAVQSEKQEEDGVLITGRVPLRFVDKLKKYLARA